jgi:hypothetical protein
MNMIGEYADWLMLCAMEGASDGSESNRMRSILQAEKLKV